MAPWPEAIGYGCAILLRQSLYHVGPGQSFRATDTSLTEVSDSCRKDLVQPLYLLGGENNRIIEASLYRLFHRDEMGLEYVSIDGPASHHTR